MPTSSIGGNAPKVTPESAESLTVAHEPVAYGVEYREGGRWHFMSGIICFDRANAERIALLGREINQLRRVTPLFAGSTASLPREVGS